jgi:hypothetical protein
MHLIIKLLLLSVLLFSNVSIFADTCLDNNLSNAEYLKNACIKNIDAWKAPMVISGILPSSVVNDTVGNILTLLKSNTLNKSSFMIKCIYFFSLSLSTLP